MSNSSQKHPCAVQKLGGLVRRKDAGAAALAILCSIRHLRLSIFGVGITTVAALFLMNPFASSQPGKTVAKDYVWQLQYWQWEVKKTPGMKPIDFKDIPNNAKLTRVRIVRQVDSKNFGSVQIGDIELRYLVVPASLPEDATDIKHVQAYLSVHTPKAPDGELLRDAGGGLVNISRIIMGERIFLSGGAHGRDPIKASAFCVVIDEGKKFTKEIWDEQQGGLR